MTQYSYTVVFEPDVELAGGYVASVPALGIATQGESLEEARTMVQEAILGCIEGLQQEGQPIPQERSEVAQQIRTEQVAFHL
jgi:predicted RNase H-like HicB family nuclease